MELLFPEALFERLSSHLFADARESAALVKLRMTARGGHTRLLAYDLALPSPQDYSARSMSALTLRPEYYVRVVAEAANSGTSVAFVHSHPHSGGPPEFSAVDDHGESELAEYVSNRAPTMRPLSVVVGPGGVRARELGRGTGVSVVRIGRSILLDGASGRFDVEVMNRQVLAFGSLGQQRISSLAVAIVGLGGTGSLVAQQLAYLGVRRFTLVDPDHVEVSNMNRVVGAFRPDEGCPKVDVAARLIRSIAPSAEISSIQDDVLRGDVIDRVIAVDAVFGCTDSHGSRALLNQIAYQYLVPCFDTGVAIAVQDGAVTHIAGRAQMLAPGLPCLACGNLLDAEAVRLDFLPHEVRVHEPYFSGASVSQPAVITINSLVASLTTTMYLSAVAGVPSEARLQLYDGVRGTVRNATYDRVPNCVVCSDTGALAKGDEWPLPSRV